MVKIVPRELLEALAARAPVPAPPATTRPGSNGTANGYHPDGSRGEYQHRLLVHKYLQASGRGFRVKPQPDSRGRTVYVLKCCPFDESHGDPDSCIMQAPNGALSAQCFHSSCSGKGWQEFKAAIGKPDADHYDPPLTPKRQQPKSSKPQRKPVAQSVSPAGGDDNYLDEADDDPHRLAGCYLERFHKDDTLSLRYWREEYLRWDGRSYHIVSDEQIRNEVTQHVRHEFESIYRLAYLDWIKRGPSASGNDKPPPPVQKVTTKLIADVLQALRGISNLYFDTESPAWLGGQDEPFPAGEALVCANGILHLPSLIQGAANLHPLTPRLFTHTALDYPFDASAAKPVNWLAFLDQIWHHDPQAIAALQEWFGYCLLPDTSQQKILMLIGPKRSGKGTIARVLSRLIGLGNIASPTLSSLGLQFGLAPLLNKTLAIISDARLSQRTDAAVVIERLLSISGEDYQTIDRKYLDSVTGKLNVRFMILTNELPKLNDPSGALVGRLILLRMREDFFGREDKTLTKTLLSELSGILLWAIEGWKRLNQRGHFQQPDTSASVLLQMEDLASPIKAFVRECCEEGPGYEVVCNQIYERWKDWCEAKGMKPGNEQTFGRDLRAALPALDDRRPRCGDTRIRVYIGIRLRYGNFSAGDEKTPF